MDGALDVRCLRNGVSSLNFFHPLLTLVVSLRSNPPSVLSIVPQVAETVHHHIRLPVYHKPLLLGCICLWDFSPASLALECFTCCLQADSYIKDVERKS